MNNHDTSAHSQRARLLAAMKATPGGITSMYARTHLNIIDPPKRASELRDRGVKMIVIYETQTDEQGRKHPHCARYIYIGFVDEQGGNNNE